MYTPDKEVMNVIALEVNQKYYTTSELNSPIKAMRMILSTPLRMFRTV